MVDDLIPAHISGRRLTVLHDPKETISQEFIDIGGYIRVSTPKEAQASSIEYQKDILKQWAEVEKYNLVKVYTDIKSGEYKYLRNELNEMLNDVKNGKIKGVLAKEISRTSRDVMDILELKREIASYGGFFISIKESYDSRADDDEFLLILHAALAQKERKQTAGRVKLTQMMKAKEGKVNSPNPAYGYMLSEDGQHYVKNPETYPTLRFIIEKYIDGWGQQKLAKYLNSRGIPGPRGKKWHTNSIRTIINNPVYLGITMYNVTTTVRTADGKRRLVVRPREEWIVRENTHEPLITQEEWDKVQHIAEQRRRKYEHEWTCERKYLGSAILRCAECGSKVYGTKINIKKGHTEDRYYYYRYRCFGRNGKCTPPMKTWKMDKVDKMLIDLVKNLFSNKERLMKSLNKQLNFCEDKDREVFARREQITNRIKKIDRAMKKQQMAFEEDVITLQEYKDRITELRNEKQQLSNTLMELDNDLTKVDTVVEKFNRVFNNLSQKINRFEEMPPQEQVFFMDNIFEAIYLTMDYKITNIVFKL
ncbi:MAG: recombinase family protein [Syntrophaceticus sp.]|jgi:DNA invertase Pin-like site-specific DNA recombinase|nr:recombinase family protein [Syntrophaceticus sp.]MDD3314408.1 recombinase family protein [Syntrophaceticus sp.]MDD4359922.1 recombinase family protein [Syntrophaceticus sp.]MDD4782729.1 recombinase family protein [Syntrophaceticus sp.]